MIEKSNELLLRAKKADYAPPKMKFNPGLPRNFEKLLIDPNKAALVNIDIQNIFTETGAPFAPPDADKIVPNVNKLAAYCRENDIPVVWVRVIHRKDKSNLGSFARLWGDHPVVADSMLVADNHWAQFYPTLELKDTDIYIEKPKYNAFWGSDLEAVLRGLNREWLIFTGIATDVCVRNTLIDAFHRDFNVVLAMDATEGLSPKNEVLQGIEMLYGRILTTDEILAELNALKQDK